MREGGWERMREDGRGWERMGEDRRARKRVEAHALFNMVIYFIHHSRLDRATEHAVPPECERQSLPWPTGRAVRSLRLLLLL